MVKEITSFFVKSHAIRQSEDIFAYLQKSLLSWGKFELDYKGIVQPPISFWKEFYSQLEPEILGRVLRSYAYKNGGEIALSLIRGDNIISNIRSLTGPTRYEANSKETIRGKFGPYELPDTLVHASSPEEVEKDIRILRKYNLIR